MRWSRGISAVQYCTGSESFPIMSCLMCFRTGELLRFSPLEKSHVAVWLIWRISGGQIYPLDQPVGGIWEVIL